MPSIVDVVPLAKLPRGKDCFSYSSASDAPLAIGQSVRIPFRRRTLDGVVWAIHDRPDVVHHSLKRISEIGALLLTPGQQRIIERTAQNYGGSRSSLIRSMTVIQKKLPSLAQERRSKQLARGDVRIEPTGESVAWLMQSIRKLTSGQWLILCPTARSAEALAAQLQSHSQNPDIRLVRPTATTRDDRRTALRLQESSPVVIVGTRRTLFFPWMRLSHIILIDEHHLAHRQWDLEPRIDNRIACQWLSEYWGAKVTFTSPLPSLSTFHRLPPETASWHWSPMHGSPNPAGSVSTWSGGVHDQQDWVAWMRSHLEANRSIAILAPNHRNGLILCRSCQRVQRCARCHRALESQASRWWCDWCRENRTSPHCEYCRGVQLKTVTSISQAIKATVEQFFPDENLSGRVAILQTSTVPGWIDDYRWNAETTFPAILIWDLLSSVQTGYIQEEYAFRLLTMARDAAESRHPASIGIANIPSSLLSAQSTAMILEWYRKEWSIRKQYRYPPAVPLLLLDTHQQVRNNTDAIRRFITTLSTAFENTAEIIGPIQSFSRRVSFDGRTAIIIRPRCTTEMGPLVKTILQHLPVGWSITPNPELLPTALPSIV